jgi:aspartyl-tRNA(Asn)/glutamyl-tRNA(Gln) amidotransferase subunit A
VPWRFLEKCDLATKKNFEDSLDVYKSLGYKLVDIDLDLLKYSIGVYYILATAEASTNLAKYDGIRYGLRSKEATTLDAVYDLSRQEGFGFEVKSRIFLGTYVLSSGYKDAFYNKAQKVRSLIIDQLNKAFSLCSIIAMPTSPEGAFKLNSIQDPIQMYLQDIYTIGANLAGIPAISIPSGLNGEGKPLGLQLLAPQLRDLELLQTAYLFEKATSFHKQIPPLFT